MCQAFIPLLSKNGRIVNVSSTGSSLNQYSKEIQQRFRSSSMTLQDLEGMMQEYQVRGHRRLSLDCADVTRIAPTTALRANVDGRSKPTVLAKHV